MNRLSKNEEHIKKTLNEQEFSFDPAHWEGAEAMLDTVLPVESKKKKRRFGFFWLILTFLAASGGVFWWVYAKDGFTAETTQQQWTADSATNLEIENEGFTSTPQTEQEYTNNTEAIEDNNNTHHAEIAGGPPTLMAAQYSGSEEKPAPNLNSSLAQKNKEIPQTNTENTPASSPITNAKTPSAKQPKDKSTAKLLSTDNGSKDEKDNESKNKGINNGGVDEGTTTTAPKNEGGSKQNNPSPNSEQNKYEQGSSDNQNTAPSSPTGLTNNATDTDTTADGLLAKDENKDTENEENNNGEGNKQILLKNSISPVVGSNYSRLLQPSGNTYSNRLYFGLLYNHYFNTRWQVAAGFGYSTVGTNGFAKQYTQQNYSFGVHTQQTTITTQQLHYLEAPVLVRYALGQNISFVGGVNINYLINTNNTLSQYSFASLSGETNTNTAATAYMLGLNRWDVQLQLGIEANFWQRMHLGLLANSGFMDVGVNNYYNNTVFDRNRRLQLYIRYDIFRF